MKTPHLPVEEVLDAILLEEATPTYEALARWCERYPEYRDELAKFFATWGEQESISQDVEIDEDRLASIGVSHALKKNMHKVRRMLNLEPACSFGQNDAG
jgi:hypothetical protein